MKRFVIATKDAYQKDGVEKTFWNRVGTLVFFPAEGEKKAGFRLKLFMFPSVDFYVFEDKPREEKIETPF